MKFIILIISGIFVRIVTALVIDSFLIENPKAGKTFITLFSLHNHALDLLAFSSITLIVCYVILKLWGLTISKVPVVEKHEKSVKFLVMEVVEVFIKVVMALSIFSISQCIFFLYAHKFPQELCAICECTRINFKEIAQNAFLIL